MRDAVDRLDGRDLGDDAEPRALARLSEVLQPFFFEALERVRARARLVRAAAQKLRAARFDDVRRLKELPLRLDGARPCHDDGRARANLDACNVNDAGLRVELPARELVALRDRDALLDARQRIDGDGCEARLVADDADDLLLRAFHDLRREAGALDGADDALDVLCRCVGIHDNDHFVLLFNLSIHLVET